MLIVLYILLGLLALFFLLLTLVIFAPLTVYFTLSNESYLIEAKYIGLWAKFTEKKLKSGFLWHKFRQKVKSDSKQSKSAQTKSQKTAKSPQKEKRAKGNLNFRLLLENRGTLKKILYVLTRFLIEIFSSFKVKLIKAKIEFAGDPAFVGIVYGFDSALREFPGLLEKLQISYNWDPTKEFNFELKFVVTNCIFKLILAPFMRAFWRLPKLEIIRLYRKSKRL